MKIDIPYPFFIATTNRSGSHFLMDLINSTKKTGRLREALLPLQKLGNKRVDADIYEGFKDAYNRSMNSRPEGMPWGIKITSYLLLVLERFFELEDLDPSELKWIWLQRRNKVRQAFSEIKRRTIDDVLLDPNQPEDYVNLATIDVKFDEAELIQYTIIFLLAELVWSTFFRAHSISPHIVVYEDFVDESMWDETVKGILDFLGVDCDLPLNVFTNRIVMSRDSDASPALYKRVMKAAYRKINKRMWSLAN